MEEFSNKIVVKVEISTLCDERGRFIPDKMERLVMVLSNLQNSGKKLLIVSSGAIALGSAKMELKMIPEQLIDKQATAAIGQAELIKVYQRFFEDYGQVVAQILITSDVVNVTARKHNAANTLNTLLGMNIIPIINENDTVSTDDIELDDNYPLVVNVAKIVEAHVILVKSHEFGKYLIIPGDRRMGNVEVKEENLVTYLTRVGENVSSKKVEECNFPSTFKELNFY